MAESIADRLEAYSRNHPDEVLVVRLELAGEVDEVMIYKGFSSSLRQSTAFDIDVPVISEQATILEIDRLQGPYNPTEPIYIQRAIALDLFFNAVDRR